MTKQKSFAILRIIFGLVWLLDAYLKWQPGFQANFVSYLANGAQGQLAVIHSWISFWITVVGVNPHLFAIFVAIAETAIALGLIFGIFPRLVSYGGIIFSLAIWSTAEGFGGPYVSGSTDIGAAVIYVLVFAALILGDSWREFSIGKKRVEKRIAADI